jgi:F-type H+-transporting ATPase subunit b
MIQPYFEVEFLTQFVGLPALTPGGGTVIVNALGSWSGMGLMTLASEGTGGGFMDSLPDPMKIQLPVVVFVIAVLVFMFAFLKSTLFQPLTKVMDDREAAIRAGGATKAEAAAQIEARQADYAARLKDLRGKAFEHRKALALIVANEKQALLVKARSEASAMQNRALADLKAEQKTAEIELRKQVEALSESMVQHLLKQA